MRKIPRYARAVHLSGTAALIRGLDAGQRLAIRRLESKPAMDKLHAWLLEIQPEVLPKSPPRAAGRR